MEKNESQSYSFLISITHLWFVKVKKKVCYSGGEGTCTPTNYQPKPFGQAVNSLDRVERVEKYRQFIPSKIRIKVFLGVAAFSVPADININNDFFRIDSQNRGEFIGFTKTYLEPRFYSHLDKENEPNIMRIGPLIRKLVFWERSLFLRTHGQKGVKYWFCKKLFRTKVFCLIETKKMSLIS